MSPRVKQERQDELVRQKKLRNTDIANHATEAVSSFATMLMLLFKQLIEKRNGPLFNALLGYLFLPVAALAAVMNATFAWRGVILKKFDNYAIAKASVASIAALTMIAVTIGLLVASAMFMVVGPIIYANVVTFKALFSAVSAIYFAVKSKHATQEEIKSEYHDKAVYAGIDAVCGLVIAGAMLTIIFVALPAVQAAMAVIGVAASMFAYAFYRMQMKHPAERYDVLDKSAAENEINEDAPTNNARLVRVFGASPTGYISLARIEEAYDIEFPLVDNSPLLPHQKTADLVVCRNR